MIYERLDLKVDLDQLVNHLKTKVFPLEPVRCGSSFGGWAVQSSNGEYTDGWQPGHLCFSNVDGKLVIDYEKVLKIGLKLPSEYIVPTKICTDYLQAVLDQIKNLGFQPTRARISFVNPKTELDWHRDAPDAQYCVRLHIPIITNSHCVFVTEEGVAHLPADGGAYLLRVNRMHKASNMGSEVRYHLIMNVTDHRHISQYHRYPLA